MAMKKEQEKGNLGPSALYKLVHWMGYATKSIKEAQAR
jgi:hypothetical protein